MDENHSLKDFHQTYIDDDILDSYVVPITKSLKGNDMKTDEEVNEVANSIAQFHIQSVCIHMLELTYC